MKFQTKYFGEIEYPEDDLIKFPAGLFGFEDERSFLLLPFADSDGTMLCLQSAGTPTLAFVVMNPFALDAGYTPALQEKELAELGVGDEHELCFYVLCVVKSPASSSTVNLQCPVAINDATNLAMQVIMETDDYGMRHLLSEFGQREGL